MITDPDIADIKAIQVAIQKQKAATLKLVGQPWAIRTVWYLLDQAITLLQVRCDALTQTHPPYPGQT